MDDIPSEIHCKIISYLPLKQIVINRTISKCWYQISNYVIKLLIPEHLKKKLIAKMVQCDPEILTLLDGEFTSKQKNHICACFAYSGNVAKIEYYLKNGATWNRKCTNYALFNNHFSIVRQFGSLSDIDTHHLPYEIGLNLRTFKKKTCNLFLKMKRIKKYQSHVSEWLNEHLDDFLKLEKISLVAIKDNNHHVLKVLNSQPNRYVFDSKDLKYVIRFGNLEMFQWMVENCLFNFKLSNGNKQNSLFCEAAFYGKLDILKYIQLKIICNDDLDSIYFQDNKTDKCIIYLVHNAYLAAVANNQRHIMNYLHPDWTIEFSISNNWTIAIKCIRNIVIKNNISALNKLTSFMISWYLTKMVIEVGNVEMLQYIHQYYPTFFHTMHKPFHTAVIHGHLHILQYLHDNLRNGKQKIIYYGKKLVLFAIQHDHLHIAKWLINFWDTEIVHSPDRSIYSSFWNQKIYGWLNGIPFIPWKKGQYEPIIVASIYNLKRTFCVSKYCYATGTIVRYVKTNQRTLDYVANYIKTVGILK